MSLTAAFSSRVLRRRALAAAALGLGLVVGAPTACGGPDDFEFGQKLVEKNYIQYARRVFEGILADGSRSAAEKDRAKFGMALLGKAELVVAWGNPKVPYADVRKKLDDAVGTIRDFVTKNGGDAKADDARMELGKLCLQFVEWSHGLAAGGEAEPKARGTTSGELLGDGEKMIETALSVFKELMEGAKKEETRQLAAFYFVTAQFYKGLVHPKCSAQAVSAFVEARKMLDDYIADHDGQLFAVYAQDNQGKACQELGDCETDPDRKWKLYQDAINQFTACADTEDLGNDYRQLIAQGYLHAGLLANHTVVTANGGTDAHPGERTSEARAQTLLKSVRGMFKALERDSKKFQQVTGLVAGVRALVQWAYVESSLESRDEAVRIAQAASKLAGTAGFADAKNEADDALEWFISQGGGSAALDPSIYTSIGDSMKRKLKFLQAIQAFQQAITAVGTSPSPKLMLDVILPCWLAIGDCYRSMKPELWIEAATAFDSVCDEVRGGRIKVLNEADAPSRLAWQAAEGERQALVRLLDLTGDASIRDRQRKFVTWENEAFKDYAKDVVGDRSYKAARDLFDEGMRAKKAADGKGSDWKRPLDDARAQFETVSKDQKSEYQDNAWAYRVRVPYESGDFERAVSEADAALAWWKTPEAQKRLEENKAPERRRTQTAATTFWKAAALRELKRLDEALELVKEDFRKKFGDDAGDYRGRAMGLYVELLLVKGQNESAEAALVDLLKADPEYFQLGLILLELAKSYEVKVNEIQAKINEINAQIAGTPEDRSKGLTYQSRAAEKDILERRNQLSGLAGQITRNRNVERETKEDEERRLAHEAAEKLLPFFKKAKEDYQAANDKFDALQKEIARLVGERTALRLQMVPPLKKTAGLYKRFDDVLKDLDAKRAAGDTRVRRKPESVALLAYRFYTLATLDPTEQDAWTVARGLYEDWLEFPDVKAKPDTDPKKRENFRSLGDVYDHMSDAALAAGKADEARDMAAKAVRYLEGSLAKNPANGPLLIEHLAGALPALNYRDPISDKTWRIPVRRVDDVAAFKKEVAGLEGDRLPRYTRDDVQREFEKAVASFKREILAKSDGENKATVEKMKAAGFDPAFFAEHCVVNSEFLLNLAHGYIRSGTAEGAAKAMNAARSILTGPSHEEDESRLWWEAKTVQLEVLVAVAERAKASEGPESPQAKARAHEADNLLSLTKQMSPLIGGTELDSQKSTLATWKALQTRLARLMASINVPMTGVDLDKQPPPPPEAEPVAPPAGDAGMDAGGDKKQGP